VLVRGVEHLSLTLGILEEVRTKEASTLYGRPKACSWEEIATVNQELLHQSFDRLLNNLRPSAA